MRRPSSARLPRIRPLSRRPRRRRAPFTWLPTHRRRPSGPTRPTNPRPVRRPTTTTIQAIPPLRPTPTRHPLSTAIVLAPHLSVHHRRRRVCTPCWSLLGPLRGCSPRLATDLLPVPSSITAASRRDLSALLSSSSSSSKISSQSTPRIPATRVRSTTRTSIRVTPIHRPFTSSPIMPSLHRPPMAVTQAIRRPIRRLFNRRASWCHRIIS